VKQAKQPPARVPYSDGAGTSIVNGKSYLLVLKAQSRDGEDLLLDSRQELRQRVTRGTIHSAARQSFPSVQPQTPDTARANPTFQIQQRAATKDEEGQAGSLRQPVQKLSTG
jgi:hypothetical protein